MLSQSGNQKRMAPFRASVYREIGERALPWRAIEGVRRPAAETWPADLRTYVAGGSSRPRHSRMIARLLLPAFATLAAVLL